MTKYRNNFFIILTCAIVFFIYGYYREIKKPDNFYGSVAVSVFQNKSVGNNSFDYQNFYLWQSNNLFLDSIHNIISSPFNIKTIFSTTDTVLPKENKIDEFSKMFKYRKSNPGGNTAIISYRDSSEEKISKVLKSMTNLLNKEISDQKNKNLLPNELSISVSEPVILIENRNTLFSSLVGLVSGIILGIILVLFKEYTK